MLASNAPVLAFFRAVQALFPVAKTTATSVTETKDEGYWPCRKNTKNNHKAGSSLGQRRCHHHHLVVLRPGLPLPHQSLCVIESTSRSERRTSSTEGMNPFPGQMSICRGDGTSTPSVCPRCQGTSLSGPRRSGSAGPAPAEATPGPGVQN
jgi:hypothetical protein